jgi:hypothetical protein
LKCSALNTPTGKYANAYVHAKRTNSHTDDVVLRSPHATAKDTREVVLRLTVLHENPQALRIFAMETAPVCVALTHANSDLTSELGE